MTQEQALEILKSGKNVFLTGEPGSGKTYTINKFIEWCDDHNRNVAITASTGIAATHIDGVTIHSWSAMGIKHDVTDADIAAILTKEYATSKMDRARVLIIDEISMLSANQLNNVDRILRAVKFTSLTGEPFGGLQVVLVGDFYQLPPVPTFGKPAPKFAFEAESWKEANFEVCYLTEQHRQSDPEFLEILTAMRNGTIEDKHIKRLLQCRLNEKPATKLFTHNVEVDRLNESELQKIDGEEKTYMMECGGNEFLLKNLIKTCMSPEKLTLRVGAVVMFTKNNFDVGYVNGTIGTVIDYSEDDMPIVETQDGQVIEAKYAEWKIDDHRAWISQVPLRLAWAITVHKSQGMSLDSATMDLSKCFESGQGYVALSRVKSLAGIHLEGLNKDAFKINPLVVEKDKEFRKLN